MTPAHPWLFLLLIPLILVLIRAWRKKAPSIVVPSVVPYEAAARHDPLRLRKLVPFLLYALSALLIVAALTRPRAGIEQIKQRAEGIDIILAIDLSGSMSAMDIPKDITTEAHLSRALQDGTMKTRLELAKEEIIRFIDARPNDRIGLIAFAPLPYMVCPPTLDHGFLVANMKRLTPGLINDGTGIAGPIASAVQRLKDSDAKSRIVVLFTDGSNNIQSKITPVQAAKLAETFHITIYTVGIGSGNAIIRQDTMFGPRYGQYLDEFDEPLLKEIASITGGRYYKAADADGMAQAMGDIDKLEKTSVDQAVTVDWKELYPAFCWLAIGSLLLAFLLQNTVFLRVP